jgi:hypothetical protein
MKRASGQWSVVSAAIIACAFVAHSLFAQETENPSKPAKNQNELALRQGRIADKYARLEQLMLKMAEIDGPTNPKRAALLKQAVQQSKDNLTKSQLDSIVKLLDQQKLKRAVDGQGEVTVEMKALLELLLSENRSDRNKSEQERIKQYIQDVERLIRLQKDVQGRTEGTEKNDNLAKDQGKVADRTGDVEKKIGENEEDSGEKKPGDQKPGDQKPGDMKPGDQKPGDQKPGDMKPGDQKPEDKKPGDEKPGDQKPEDKKPGDEKPMKPGDMKPGDQKPGDMKPGDMKPGDMQPGEQKPGDMKPMPGQPMQGQPMPMQGEPMPGQPMNQQPMQQQAKQENPARKRLQQAEQKMRDAQKKLEEAKREDAKEAQEQARQELEKAKAELEEILRQLREEEIERTLAQLESRFRKMLEMQLKVNEATSRLASIPADARTSEIDIESNKLAVEERKIALEADKAYQLLLEEGSSIAFPESVEEMHHDMEAVAARLAQTKLDQVTIGTEEDIVAALQELIAALQQAQKDQEEKKKQEQQQQQQQQGEPEDQPLVDAIAELKMLKSMQLRVNDRTKRFSKLLTEPDDLVGQATEADLNSAIEKLGERQQRLHRITRDIVLGKNQ